MEIFKTRPHPVQIKTERNDDGNSQSEDLALYFKTFFSLEHILCSCPFRLKSVKDEESSSVYYIAVSWLPHKMLCILLIILNIFWMIRDVRLSIPTTSENKNPSVYILLALNLSSAALKFSMFKIVWLHQTQILEMMNFIADNDNFLSKPSNHNPTNHSSSIVFKFRQVMQSKTFQISCLGLIYSGFEFACWLLGEHIGRNVAGKDGKYPKWSLTWWWNRITETGYFNFFINDGMIYKNSPALNWVVGILSAAGYLLRRVTAAYGDLTIMVAVLTLRSSVIAFTMSLRVPPEVAGRRSPFSFGLKNEQGMIQLKNKKIGNNNLELGQKTQSPPWAVISRQYCALKTLSKLINKLLGSVFGNFLLEFIMYYAVMFDEVFVMVNWLKITRVVFYFGQAVLILMLAADIPKQMNALKEWLSVRENRSSVPADEQNLILNELDSKVVSIKGNGVFAITHSTLANMLAVTVTYFIICVQV